MAVESAATVALPAAIAYPEPPRRPSEVGIYSALFPLLAHALFGSSRELILGPRCGDLHPDRDQSRTFR
jgi:MFS superfamily sulfate permease-like transporter